MFALVFSCAVNLLFLAPALFMMQVYDRVLVSHSVTTLAFLSLVLVVGLAVLAYLDYLRSALLQAANLRLDRLFASDVLQIALASQPNQSPRFRSQIVRDFDVVRQVLTGQSALAAFDLPWTPIYMIICFVIHPWLGALVLVCGLVLLAIAWHGEMRTRDGLKAQAQSESAYAVIENDAVFGDVARALGMEAALVRRQLLARRALIGAQTSVARTVAETAAVTKFVRLATQSAVLATGALLAISGAISAGALIAASIIATRAFAPLEQVVGAWRQTGLGWQAFQSLKAALSAAQAPVERTKLPRPRGLLAVEGVSLRLPSRERPVLQTVSFQVEPGEILGVLGPSGAGKSSLARVVAGAVAPSQGVVRLDGANLRDWEPEDLGRFVGFLPQESGLFAGTVADNICRFESRDDHPDRDEAVVRAAQLANAHRLILSLPQAYETRIGPSGQGLSAGQIQRVGLARALYRDPSLIVLDEPNAHLDAEGERALVRALKQARSNGAAILVVAHRSAFLSIADRLLVLRDGRAELLGPRDQVVERLNAGKNSGPAGSGRPEAAAPEDKAAL
jgi:ATP-binding cassette subfamily C protein